MEQIQWELILIQASTKIKLQRAQVTGSQNCFYLILKLWNKNQRPKMSNYNEYVVKVCWRAIIDTESVWQALPFFPPPPPPT